MTERCRCWAHLMSTGIMVGRSRWQKWGGRAQVAQTAQGRSRVICSRKGFWKVLMYSCPRIWGQTQIHHWTLDPSLDVMVSDRFSRSVKHSGELSSQAWCNLVWSCPEKQSTSTPTATTRDCNISLFLGHSPCICLLLFRLFCFVINHIYFQAAVIPTRTFAQQIQSPFYLVSWFPKARYCLNFWERRKKFHPKPL